MIQIDDFDLPIQVVEKIVSGTKEVPASMLDKAAYKAFTGEDLGEVAYRDMFKLEEIKEIAGYLMVYYESHIDNAERTENMTREEARFIMNEIKNGARFYDERNGRYLTVDGINTDPKTAMCIVEEMNDEGEYEVVGRQLFSFGELKHFSEV